MMPTPVLTFAFILATMYGLGFHVILGGGPRRLVLFVVTGWLGFGLGDYLGRFFEIALLKIGVLHLLPATAAAFALLIVAHLLTSESKRQVSRRQL